MRKYILIFVLVSVTIISCNMENGGKNSHVVFRVGNESLFKGSCKSTQILPASNISKVYFRSSDIEFWSIDAISDIDNLMSAAYENWGSISANLQKSVNVELPDITETFIFKPDAKTEFQAVNTPCFQYRKYNLARLDLGGGNIIFVINGNEITVDSSAGSGSQLNCNSIFFVDSAFLNTAVYIDRTEARAIEAGNSSGYAVIDRIIRNSNYNSNFQDGMIDVDGALFLTFDPIDFSNYENLENIAVDVTWDMENIITYNDNDTPADTSDDSDFLMVDRVENTCFDFQIRININTP